MTFSVYSTTSNHVLIQIHDNTVEFIAPAYSQQLKKIDIETCFAVFIQGQKEEIFGTVKEISKGDPLYPTALKMYCQAQLLTHPETYTDKPSRPTDPV